MQFEGELFEAKQSFSPFNVVAWHGNYVPYRQVAWCALGWSSKTHTARFIHQPGVASLLGLVQEQDFFWVEIHLVDLEHPPPPPQAREDSQVRACSNQRLTKARPLRRVEDCTPCPHARKCIKLYPLQCSPPAGGMYWHSPNYSVRCGKSASPTAKTGMGRWLRVVPFCWQMVCL